MNKLNIIKEYQDGLIFKWNDSIWVVKADGDQPALWPVAHVKRDEQGQLAFVIPKGTDMDNAHAVLASILGLNDFFK